MSTVVDHRVRDRLSRAAVSSLIAVVGAIALINSCGMIPHIIVWWLAYVLGCGVVLDSTRGERPSSLFVMAFLPATIPVVVYGFFILREIPICFSMPRDHKPLIYQEIDILIGSWLAIFLFSFIREPAKQALEILNKANFIGDVERVVTGIQALLAGIVTVVLVVAALGQI